MKWTYNKYRCFCLKTNRHYVHVSKLLIVSNFEEKQCCVKVIATLWDITECTFGTQQGCYIGKETLKNKNKTIVKMSCHTVTLCYYYLIKEAYCIDKYLLSIVTCSQNDVIMLSFFKITKFVACNNLPGEIDTLCN